MAGYLQQRRRRWYVVLEVPKALRETYGKRRLITSLKTESKSEAERLVLVVVAGWKAEFEAVRNGASIPDERLAREWRGDYAKADQNARETLEGVLDDKLHEIAEASKHSATTFGLVVRGETVVLDEHLEDWLSHLDNQPKTLDMKRSDVQRFIEKFPYSHLVTKRDVQKWAFDLQQSEDLKQSTVQRIISSCRGYWLYLDKSGRIDRDDAPFLNVLDNRSGRTKASKNKIRRAFQKEDVVKLFQAAEAKGDQQLAYIILIGMWTGCRIEEICSLKLEDVHRDRFIVHDAKTAAGNRSVPIHTRLSSMVDELCGTSLDGYLVSGLSFNKYRDRSNAVGKRFGHLKRSLGFGPEYVFHSIRKTVATLLENAGVPEGVTADIMGHEKQTITYGLYSGGNTFEVMRDAIEKLAYPI